MQCQLQPADDSARHGGREVRAVSGDTHSYCIIPGLTQAPKGQRQNAPHAGAFFLSGLTRQA